MDYMKLERAVVELGEKLAEAPDWSVVATVEGVFIRQFPTHLDGERLASVTHAHLNHARHLLHDVDNGGFRSSICIGTQGSYFVVLLGETHLLGLDYQHIKSIDAVLASLQENIKPLLEALGIG